MNNRISENFNLERATNNVLRLKQDVGKGIIAIGEHIAIVKANMGKKEFLDWLRADVKIHRATAYRYMKVADQVDYRTLEKVGVSKVFDIVEAPITEEEKQKLLSKADTTTVQQIREEIRELKGKEEPVVVVESTELPEEVDSFIDEGIDFIERAEKMRFDELPENWKQFVRSQLEMIAKVIKKVSDNV